MDRAMDQVMLRSDSETVPASVLAPRPRIAADGTVEGYASLFGAIDEARDMVMPGAFAQTLRLRPARRVPMLFQHDPSEPVGIWLELAEDHRGLFARGRLIPEVARARELIALIEAGAIDGLSIGFRAARARVDPATRVRRLYAVDLWEISIVTFPLLSGARVRRIKGESAAEVANVPGRLPRRSLVRARSERERSAPGSGERMPPAPRRGLPHAFAPRGSGKGPAPFHARPAEATAADASNSLTS